MVMKTVSVKSARTMVSQIGGPCGGRARTTRRRQVSAGGRTRVDIEGLTGLASKPPNHAVCDGVRENLTGLVSNLGETGLINLDLKTESEFITFKIRADGTWQSYKLEFCFGSGSVGAQGREMGRPPPASCSRQLHLPRWGR